jgi:hypothetical protein
MALGSKSSGRSEQILIGPMTTEVLYEDKYVRLTNSEMHLKWYFFPVGTKVIPYHDIKSFGRAAQYGIGFWGIKSWGMALSLVWWSLGPVSRNWDVRNQLIVEVRDQTLLSGFTALNPAQALTILRTKVSNPPDRFGGETVPLM